MNFVLAVGRTILLRPHRALAALYWHMTGRKVRARNRLRLAVAQSSSAYTQWIDNIERLDEVASSVSGSVCEWTKHPLFSIILFISPEMTAKAVKASMKSIQAQYYGRWELLLFSADNEGKNIADELGITCQVFAADNAAQAINIGTARAKGDYVIPLDAGDRLSPAAIFRYAEAIQHESPALLYGDEDRLNWRGKRISPWFKPEWNEELFLAQDYISSACAFRADLGRPVLPVEDEFAPIAIYALLLRIIFNGTGDTVSIRPIPHILCHRTKGADDSEQKKRIAAVACRLSLHDTEVRAGPFGSLRVIRPLPDELPLVSIIVPTRDNVKLLSTCVDDLLSTTTYPNYEIIIVDNDSIEISTHNYMEKISRIENVRILKFSGTFNYSSINNYAVAKCRGDYICLLNNDIEIIGGDWLTDMMRQAIRPHVGAVGAKLLYADGSIQHAGVIIGMGEAAGHAHRFLGKGRPGYFNQPHLTQYMSAVTAACLVVEKRKFESVGGLDEERFAVAFNDVDLCLRLETAGWRNIYEPHAVLIHHESKSRGRDISPQHIDRYLRELSALQERWNTKTYMDPQHNPNLNRAHETFTIRIL